MAVGMADITITDRIQSARPVGKNRAQALPSRGTRHRDPFRWPRRGEHSASGDSTGPKPPRPGNVRLDRRVPLPCYEDAARAVRSELWRILGASAGADWDAICRPADRETPCWRQALEVDIGKA